jgi:hypothetical protein
VTYRDFFSGGSLSADRERDEHGAPALALPPLNLVGGEEGGMLGGEGVIVGGSDEPNGVMVGDGGVIMGGCDGVMVGATGVGVVIVGGAGG